MLLSPAKPLALRAVHALGPGLLATSIVFIYASFLQAALAVLRARDAAPGGAAATALAALAVTALFFMTLWSLGAAVATDAGAVPPAVARAFRGVARAFAARQFDAPAAAAEAAAAEEEEEEEEEAAAAAEEARALGGDDVRVSLGAPAFPPAESLPEALFERPGPHDPRWCRACRAVKPPRAHHCSICERCVLKMDHHCPWVGNCVGYGNYKAFMLLLVHGLAATLVVAAWWLPLAVGAWVPAPSVPPDFSYALILDVAYAFTLALFAGAHASLIVRGRTTLEAAVGDDAGTSPYSLGARENCLLVFGAAPRAWLLPRVTPDVARATCGGADFTRTLRAAARGDPPALRDYALALARAPRAPRAAPLRAASEGTGSSGASASAADMQRDK